MGIIEDLAKTAAEYWKVIVLVLFAIFIYAFLQAGVASLSDWFKAKFFKKIWGTPNGKNGGMTAQQAARLIEIGEEQTEKLECLPIMAKQTAEMHGATMKQDGEGVSRIANAFRRVHELHKRIFKKGTND